jgi:UDP-N-acetylmuramate dehydrogenase
MKPAILDELRSVFGDRMQEGAPLSGYTAARIGGPADALVFAYTAEDLIKAADTAWKMEIPLTILGGGSNVLVSDLGVDGMVIINRTRLVKFHSQEGNPTVHVESGVTPNDVAQRAARLGLSGLEWVASIPGSFGGAVYGNAGAFGGEMAKNVISVDLFHRQDGRQTWSNEKMEYGYRTSRLKREHLPVLIISAELQLVHGDMQEIQAKMEQFSAKRRATQPHGASMGSIFKNPPGDKAGRLLEAAGLKGKTIGHATISPQHANFFINSGMTKAVDMRNLIELAQRTVLEKSGIKLETEVEFIGKW